jgi:hypothetical protein
MNYREVSTKKVNPLLPFIGFIVLLVTGGLSYLAAPRVAVWLTEARWVLGVTQVLPLSFPTSWSPLTIQLAVASGMFLVIFVIAMTFLFVVMGTSRGPMDVSVGELREERKRRAKELRRRSRR